MSITPWWLPLAFGAVVGLPCVIVIVVLDPSVPVIYGVLAVVITASVLVFDRVGGRLMSWLGRSPRETDDHPAGQS